MTYINDRHNFFKFSCIHDFIAFFTLQEYFLCSVIDCKASKDLVVTSIYPQSVFTPWFLSEVTVIKCDGYPVSFSAADTAAVLRLYELRKTVTL